MNVSDSNLGVFLLCDVCEGEIMLPEDFGDTGCCTACGIAYIFDRLELRESVSA